MSDIAYVTCLVCGQHQRVQSHWLTCEYCAMLLRDHPYFETKNGKAYYQDQRQLGNEGFCTR